MVHCGGFHVLINLGLLRGLPHLPLELGCSLCASAWAAATASFILVCLSVCVCAHMHVRACACWQHT